MKNKGKGKRKSSRPRRGKHILSKTSLERVKKLAGQLQEEPGLLEKRREKTLREQAALLDLAQEAVIVRDPESIIRFWNRGAAEMYGWSAEEAQGKVSDMLLKTRFPEPFDKLREKLFAEGSWSGELGHTTRDGRLLFVSSRQVVQRDSQGRIVRILEINRDNTDQKAAEESLRRLSGRVLQLQDAERRRIARDLHDSTGQTLAALSIHLAAISKRTEGADPTTAEITQEAMEMARRASDEIRTMSYLLHPPTLEIGGVRSALSWFIEGFIQRSKIQVDLEVSPDLGRLSQDLEIGIFRIVQEALTNIFRHSKSSTARIRVGRESGNVRLEVADSGGGMPSHVLKSVQTGGGQLGVGLSGIRDRINQLDGWWEIGSGSAGTTITVLLPLREPSNAGEARGGVGA